MTIKRKFAAGDRAWRSTCRTMTEYRIVGTVGRSYLIALPGQDPAQARKVSYQQAERDYRSDADLERLEWQFTHRRALINLIDETDVETLKLVAATLGYEPGKKAEGREGDDA